MTLVSCRSALPVQCKRRVFRAHQFILGNFDFSFKEKNVLKKGGVSALPSIASNSSILLIQFYEERQLQKVMVRPFNRLIVYYS